MKKAAGAVSILDAARDPNLFGGWFKDRATWEAWSPLMMPGGQVCAREQPVERDETIGRGWERRVHAGRDHARSALSSPRNRRHVYHSRAAMTRGLFRGGVDGQWRCYNFGAINRYGRIVSH